MIKIFTIVFFIFTINIHGQSVTDYTLDSVVVTTNRTPVMYSEVGRSLDIITIYDIQMLPATNVQDLLDFTSGVDLKQRGPEGIQADISIRGGSFEQTLILLDGIKLSDPQTGHHNLNIPISLSQIEKIEILKGQGSRVYGANAFGGVINIIPKNNSKSRLNVELKGGENNFFGLGVNGALNIGNSNHNIAFERSKSDGYRHNTEFENYSVSLNNSFNLNSAVIKSIFGYNDKDFGANSYYTSRFPNQSESTQTLFAALLADILITDFNLTPRIYWRNNEDEFLLEKFNPSFYKNNHTTNIYGSELQVSTNILGGTTSFGLEFIRDNIESNNLGKHSRYTTGFFVEQKLKVNDKISLSVGGFAYHYSQIDWKFWPGIDIAYILQKNLKFFGNYGRAFRIPTYTELYYSDPVTNGNSMLQPEESDNYEFGIDYNFGIFHINTSYFRKEGKNLIDYVLDNTDDLWNAQNFTEINTNGVETGFQINLSKLTNDILSNFQIDYTYLDSDKANLNINSRYVLEHLKHDLKLKIYHKLPLGINQSWVINYEDRITLEDHFTIDTKLSKSFYRFNISLKISNLLNKSYEEIPGVVLPGRWIIAGMNFDVL